MDIVSNIHYTSKTATLSKLHKDGEISVHDLVHYPWPDPDDPGRTRGLREQVFQLRASGDYSIIVSLPGSFIQQSQLLRGFSSWYLDAALSPSLLCALLDQVMEIQMATCDKILASVADVVDIVMSFDDLATQDRLIVSPAAYQKLLEPRLYKFYHFLRSKTSAKILSHTDGAAAPIFESLIWILSLCDGPPGLMFSASAAALRCCRRSFGGKWMSQTALCKAHFPE